MKTNNPIRFLHAISALATGLVCAASLAQAPGTPPDRSNAAVPAGATQIEPPTDPLVQRRDANKRASDEYRAKKKAARSEYHQSVKSAKQDKTIEKKANDAKMRQQMSTAVDGQKN